MASRRSKYPLMEAVRRLPTRATSIVPTEERLIKPQQNPEAYRRSLPLHFSGILQNPLLVGHGIVDNNVMFQDAVELTGKLAHEGKDSPAIYNPAKSHSFVRGETLIDSFRRTGEWLDRYLK